MNGILSDIVVLANLVRSVWCGLNDLYDALRTTHLMIGEGNDSTG